MSLCRLDVGEIANSDLMGLRATLPQFAAQTVVDCRGSAGHHIGEGIYDRLPWMI